MRIYGQVSDTKQFEFEQTINFVKDQLSNKCVKSELNENDQNPEVYEFDIVWSSLDEMNSFINTDLYKSIIGAFKVLGKYESTTINEIDIRA